MKVTLEKEYRQRYTLIDLDAARAVIASCKEDESTAKEYAEYAAREALRGTGDWPERIIEAVATTARNVRAWNAYGETYDMDVWIDFIAETSCGFLKAGAYLSDIFQGSAEYSYQDHMFIRHYTR